MQLNVGDILEGKVTSITTFGAFISLPGSRNGLVHISEIANAYVKDVHDHLTEGQEVKIKVVGINTDGKINLSIKQTEERVAPISDAPRPAPRATRTPYPQRAETGVPGDQRFEEKLKQFMQDSDSRISDSRIYSERKNGYRRKKN